MAQTMRRGLLVLCVLLGAAAAASGQEAATDNPTAIVRPTAGGGHSTVPAPLTPRCNLCLEHTCRKF